MEGLHVDGIRTGVCYLEGCAILPNVEAWSPTKDFEGVQNW